MRARHFYHAYLKQGWRPVAAEHARALEAAGFTWPVTVGLVGAAAERDWARAWFASAMPVTAFAEAEAGFEQVTLNALHNWLSAPDAGAVMYCHTKGLSYEGLGPLGATGHYGAAWRRSMTRHVVGQWRQCLQYLDAVQAVGCHWINQADVPGYPDRPVFAGNFWWARTDYLQSLPPVGQETRFDAETWVGIGRPSVHDLRPGWPMPAMFAREMVTAMNPHLRDGLGT